MEYLNYVLGIHTRYENELQKAMPNYILSRYKIQRVSLDGKQALFVYTKGEMEAVSSVKKHLEKIEKAEGIPAILIPERLTYRQKEYLLRDHIPFVVDGKQIYLPFMAVYLQERGDGERQEQNEILPSAQLLLLYYIYSGCGELETSKAAKALGFTATSISRASRQLEGMGLVRNEKRGVQKVILSELSPEKLFDTARTSMSNPVKRTIYVPKASLMEKLPLSGYSALAEYTMISSPPVECYAAASITAWDKIAANKLQDPDEQCAVQLWRYAPGKLASNGIIDRLSLALALSQEKDERIETAVEELLEKAWEEIDGKRN